MGARAVNIRSAVMVSGRRLETSELIRAYGELKPLAQPEAEKTAHGGTALGTQDVAMILTELKALWEEVAERRQAMRLIEHKPEPAQPDTLESVPNNTPSQHRLLTGCGGVNSHASMISEKHSGRKWRQTLS